MVGRDILSLHLAVYCTHHSLLSTARPIIATYGLSISASIYIYVYLVCESHFIPGITARVQNGFSGSYMDAVFELVVHEESESWTSLQQFYQGRPTTAPRLVEFVYPLYKQRYECWTRTARSSDANVSFKHYSPSVVASMGDSQKIL